MPDNDRQEAIKVVTSRFGELEAPAERVVYMPNGMIGFPQFHRFLPIQHREGSPFFWLQCLDEPELAFVVVSPIHFDPKYQVTLGAAETKLLKVEDPAQIQVWAVVTIPHGQPDKMTANLKAPVVINMANRLGAQMILEDPRYSLRAPLANPAAMAQSDDEATV